MELTEQAHGKTSQRADAFDVLRVDVTEMSSNQRKEVLDEWFNYLLRCNDGSGHRWTMHQWMSELKAWLWGPCEKCGVYRLTQTTGNIIVWHHREKYGEALIIDKDFEKLERSFAKL